MHALQAYLACLLVACIHGVGLRRSAEHRNSTVASLEAPNNAPVMDMSVEVLQAQLKKRGLSTNGSKKELATRLENAMQAEAKMEQEVAASAPSAAPAAAPGAPCAGGPGAPGAPGAPGGPGACGGPASAPTTPPPTPKPKPDPECIPDTGRRCWNGPSDCEPWVACSEDYFCVCHHWGCADQKGTCKPIKSKWIEPAVRIAPLLARHSYLTMKVENKGGPTLVEEWPTGPGEDEAMWNLLMQHDGSTVQITTKKSRYWKDGWFLSLPPPPWDVSSLLTPIADQPYTSQEAAWHLVERKNGAVAFLHLWSGRYLCYDAASKSLSSCGGAMCDKYSTDFDIWPRLVGVPFGAENSTQKPKPREELKVKPEPPNPYSGETKPWKERESNTSAAAALGFAARHF